METNNKKESNKSPFFGSLFLTAEKEYFIDNFSTLLASGVGVLSALEILIKETKSRRMRKMIEQMHEEISDGSYIWKSLEKFNLLPEHINSLIRIGEQSGRLAENLKVIAIQQRKDREFQSKVRSAMMYPVFVFSVTLVVGIGVAWFVLPRLTAVFSQLKVGLPTATKALIAVGDFLSAHGVVFVPIFLLVIFLLFYFTFFFRKTRFIGQALLFVMPGAKTLIQQIEMARFGYILGNLLQAGVPIGDALDSLPKATPVRRYQKFYAFLKENVSDGNSVDKCITLYDKKNLMISSQIQGMIAAAEQSGSLAEALIKIGEISETKTEATTKNLMVVLEPIMLFIIWLGVVFVAIAIILPIYSLVGGLSSGVSPM